MRARRSALIAVACFAATSMAAPVPAALKKPTNPFPTAVGTTWEYVREGDAKCVTRETISESTEAKGARTIKVAVEFEGTNKWTDTYRIEADGSLNQTIRIGVAYDAPRLQRPGFLKEGDSWDMKYTEGGIEFEAKYEVGRTEELTTPAGTFTAYPIRPRYIRPKVNDSHTFWYADGVGLVRHTIGTQVMRELKSFTPGKDAKK